MSEILFYDTQPAALPLQSLKVPVYVTFRIIKFFLFIQLNAQLDYSRLNLTLKCSYMFRLCAR